MCGLAGIFDTRARSDIDRGVLERMNQVQLHRGPDEGGVHLEPGVGLAHRRLSIIDLSSGQQPLFNEDDSVVVYNGEIYDCAELAAELTSLGHRFRTHCDTEVIVHAWEEWGESCVTHFRGMSAFALWDRNGSQLFLARDRLGIKPLYFSLLANGHLIFGSELKALTQHPGLRRALDEQAVEEYSALGYIPEPRTIYRDSCKLRPGHTLSLRRGQPDMTQRPYWDVSFALQAGSPDLKRAAGELTERLQEAVRIRLVADVPLGAFLSGGVDSGSVVAMMAQVSAEPVNTCSIAFGEAEYNEAGYAAAVFRFHASQAPTEDPLSLAQYLDLKIYLPGDILTKVDRASMANSLEVRVPLLDHELVNWISTLPVTLKRRGNEGKYLLKKAMEPWLPGDILYRPKRGFAVPLAEWFRGTSRACLRAALDSAVLAAAGVFDHRRLQRLFEQHERGPVRLEHTALVDLDVRGLSGTRATVAGRPSAG